MNKEEITLDDYVLTNINIDTRGYVIRLKDNKEYQVYVKKTRGQKAYDYIAEVFMSDELADQGVTFDAFASRIIVESNSGKVKIDGVSVYSFMKKMKIENLIQENSINKDFDIEEWSADIERRSEEEEDN